MTDRIYLNNDWVFSFNYSDEMLSAHGTKNFEIVRIPHTVVETPFNYFDESIYQTVSGYAKIIFAPKEWEGKSVRLTFEGVAHQAVVYINGHEVISNYSGYTAFTATISEFLNYGEDNLITVKVDSNETLNQPPFGYVIDYMTYGGIYRDVYIEVSDMTHIKDTFVTSAVNATNDGIRARVLIANDISKLEAGMSVKVRISDRVMVPALNDSEAYDMNKVSDCFKDGTKVKIENIAHNDDFSSISLEVSGITLWDVNDPALYDICVEIHGENGEIIDRKAVRHGFRTSEFKKDGYYLNGRKLKIRGLNRHQSYPYVGYAMPDSMQRLDADILKKELGVNAVRTSHYPQAHSFISRCDEIGLLVFTEIPGWQHIGDEEWKDKAVDNVVRMVTEYRNHPSIILWGVRINESQDDDELYKRTNKAAHELDGSRPTGGVRCIKNSNLFEDVYTYNDFVHDGTTKGCEPKKNVTSDVNKPYLISEYNGHMYPTKAFDSEEHRREHALRHATVLNAVATEQDIAGSFGWCMFDYNTHKDFGSGDRICYHGVLDMFRNHKLAAKVYASCDDENVVLDISSTMDIGEHPGSNRGKTYIFTNADSVKMYKNDRLIKEYIPSDSEFSNLSHGPILINDLIGDAIYENENFSKGQADTVKEILNLTALTSITHLPKRVLLLALKAILVYHMKPSDAVSLFSKYIGDWGGTSTVYKFEAIKDGKVVKTLVKSPTKAAHIVTDVSHSELRESKSYDVALVRIRAVDDCGNQISFFNEPIEVETKGPVEIIGDKVIGLKGGMAGVYVRTKGEAGEASVTIKNSQCEAVTVRLTVSCLCSE